DFITFFFQLGKKIIESGKIFISFPNEMFLFVTQFKIRLMYRKIKLVRIIYQLVSEPAHRFASPEKNRIFINRQSGIWYYQIFINTNHITIAITNRASPVRIIKAE